METHGHEPVFRKLLTHSFDRAKDKWQSYLNTTVKLSLYIILIILIFALVSLGFAFVSQSVPKVAWALLFVIEVVAGLFALGGVLGFAILLPLMQTHIVITEKPLSFEENFLFCRSLFKRYILFGVRLFLLSLALIPANMVLSAIFKVSILSLLISFWGAFNILVILETRLNGLDNLWMSRAKINRGWFKNIFRMIGVYLIAVFPAVAGIIVLAIAAVFSPYWLRITLVCLGVISLYLYAFAVGLFVNAFRFELYKDLPKPTKIWKPTSKQMIIFIVASWIIAAALLPFLPKKPERNMNRYTQNSRSHKYFYEHFPERGL